jgi:hypothetical protein
MENRGKRSLSSLCTTPGLIKEQADDFPKQLSGEGVYDYLQRVHVYLNPPDPYIKLVEFLRIRK